MRFGLLLFAVLLVSTASLSYFRPDDVAPPTDGKIQWVRSYSQALRLAKQENKPIVTDLYTDWCHWCTVMDENTFTDPTVVAESRQYIYLKLNAEEDPDGIELQRKFKVMSYPTILVIDQEGQEIDRINGFQTAEPFRKSLNEILHGTSSLAYLRRREREDGSDVRNLYELGVKYFGRYDFSEAIERFERIVVQDSANLQGLTDSALLYKSISDANLGRIEKSLDTLASIRTEFPDSDVLPEADLISAEIYMKTDRPLEARRVYEGFLRRYPKHQRATWVRRMLLEI